MELIDSAQDVAIRAACSASSLAVQAVNESLWLKVLDGTPSAQFGEAHRLASICSASFVSSYR
ncbi:hypothetical protein MY494_12615 [Synechococcus sp. A10-1-5-1]|uniref:hypothetical protein n=1 Tax=Synechococcus sp. A10-1-5-1 TaxID=2936507 RepID=UPI002001005D|nr:hypothetical protein [Synechococcus sp. A10-1-5-1]UPM50128.1 hypothetical protein MY494_12615 [Synechococcus sp. A10-1-5-1]